MRVSGRRVRAIFRKELREYRRNGSIVATMAVLPLVFLIQPLVSVIALASPASSALANEHVLIYMLTIPAIVPVFLAAYSIVGERQQATLEPMLTTPIPREEFLLAKALASFVPALVVAYGVFALFLVLVALFAQPSIASAVIRSPDLVAQLLFTPPLAVWSIWIGMGISARAKDARVAQQLAVLASLPTAIVAALIAFNVIPVSLWLGLVAAAALLVLDVIGWRVVSRLFDRERLVTT